MERLVIIAVVVLLAAAVALVLDRRTRRDAPTQPRGNVPAQLDRADFAHPEVPWLVATFSSTTCDACAAAATEAASVQGDPDVAVVDVPVESQRRVHERYGIDAVPILVIADHEGVVQRAFVGPPDPGQVAEALRAARNPTSASAAGRLRIVDDGPPAP